MFINGPEYLLYLGVDNYIPLLPKLQQPLLRVHVLASSLQVGLLHWIQLHSCSQATENGSTMSSDLASRRLQRCVYCPPTSCQDL